MSKSYINNKYIIFDCAKLPYMGVGAFISWVVTFLLIAKEINKIPVLSNASCWVWNVNKDINIFKKIIDLSEYCIFDDSFTIPNNFYYTTDYLIKILFNITGFDVSDIINGSSIRVEQKYNLVKQIFKLPVFSKQSKYFSNFSLNSPPKCICLIRTGDKTSGPWAETSQIGLVDYVETIKKTPYNDVYLIADSLHSINILKKWSLSNTSRLNIHFDFEIRNPWFGFYHRNKMISDKDIEDMFSTYIKNFILMKQCECLIGANASFYFRIGQMLNNNSIFQTLNLSKSDKFKRTFPF